jgi:uncharacterized DUF497 family protein
VKITFDPPKRLRTLAERGLDFAVDGPKVLSSKIATVVDDRRDYGEVRYSSAGWLGHRMVTVIWTERGDACHIISMRFCHGREVKKILRRFEQN